VKVVLVLVVAAVVSLAAITVPFLMLGTETVATYYVLGLSHAFILASCLLIAHSAFLAHDREAIWQLRGAWGEENTRDELKRAKRRRLIWGWVDSINLQAGDLDHLVVTRYGGLVALDSKWRSQATAADNMDIARAASRARLRAEALTQTLLKGERGARHRDRANPLTVRSAVVLWGAAQHTVPHGTQIDGIDFVAGRKLRQWLAGLEDQPVAKDAAADILTRLETYRAGAWKTTDGSIRSRR
jgi:hypothetical protein